MNVASVSLGWPDLGPGAALGSNVPALPLAFGLSYLGARFAAKSDQGPRRQAEAGTSVKPQAVPLQVLPYLGVVLLLGAVRFAADQHHRQRFTIHSAPQAPSTEPARAREAA